MEPAPHLPRWEASPRRGSASRTDGGFRSEASAAGGGCRMQDRSGCEIPLTNGSPESECYPLGSVPGSGESPDVLVGQGRVQLNSTTGEQSHRDGWHLAMESKGTSRDPTELVAQPLDPSGGEPRVRVCQATLEGPADGLRLTEDGVVLRTGIVASRRLLVTSTGRREPRAFPGRWFSGAWGGRRGKVRGAFSGGPGAGAPIRAKRPRGTAKRLHPSSGAFRQGPGAHPTSGEPESSPSPTPSSR